MLSINVKTNIDQVIRTLDQRFRKQIPFATSKALTATAKDVQRALTEEINQVFDRPTPFTQRAIGMTASNKQTLTAKVFIKDIQAAYLKLEVSGGTRLPAKRAIVIPVEVARNQYGNMTRGKLKQLLARKDVFSGTVRGIPGIWQRNRKGGVKLLIAYTPRAQYKRLYPFYEIAKREVERKLLPNFREAFAYAIATAR